MLFDHVLAVELAVINSAGADTIGKQRGKNPYVVRTEIIGDSRRLHAGLAILRSWGRYPVSPHFV